MSRLSDDLRESSDSLDTILKRHKTNLYECIRPYEYHCEYYTYPHHVEAFEEFKKLWSDRLDLTLDDICEKLDITKGCCQEWNKKLQKTMNTTRSKLRMKAHEDYLDKQYPLFKDLYLHHLELDMFEVREQVGISIADSGKLVKRVMEEEGVVRTKGRTHARLSVVKGSTAHDTKYDMFIKLYFDCLNLTMVEVKKMLDLTDDQYIRYTRRIRKETGLKRYYNSQKHKIMIIADKKGGS